MAKRYRYKPYRSRRKSNNRNLLIIIILIAAVSAWAVYKLKYADKSQDKQPDITRLPGMRETEDPLERPIPKPGDYENEQQLPDPDDNNQPQDNDQNDIKKVDPGDAVIPPVENIKTDPVVLTRINDALDDAEAGYLISARDKLNDILKAGRMDMTVRNKVKVRMSQLAGQWLFGNKVLAGDTICSYYKVAPGDYLSTIGRDYKVPHEFLMRINNIKDAKKLQAGKNIKVVKGPFRVEVTKSSFTLDIYIGDMFVKTYNVGLGKAESETPTGLWMVKRGGKLVKPEYQDPDTRKVYLPDDPDYPIGSRWIELHGLEGNAKGRDGFAIHGTNEPESIGKRSSRGCIRLHNGEVVEVFNMLVEVDSEVLVRD